MFEAGTVSMSGVEQPDCYEYYSKQFYEELILIPLVRKLPFLAIVGHNPSGGPCDGLALNWKYFN